MSTTVGYYHLADGLHGMRRYQLRTARSSTTQPCGLTVGNLRAFLADADMAELPDDTGVRIEDVAVPLVGPWATWDDALHRVSIEAQAHILVSRMGEA